jgi:hypothetical protein
MIQIDKIDGLNALKKDYFLLIQKYQAIFNPAEFCGLVMTVTSSLLFAHAKTRKEAVAVIEKAVQVGAEIFNRVEQSGALDEHN